MLCPELIVDETRVLPRPDKPFISLSSFVFHLVQRKELLAYFNHGCLSLMSCFNPEQRTQLAFRHDESVLD